MHSPPKGGLHRQIRTEIEGKLNIPVKYAISTGQNFKAYQSAEEGETKYYLLLQEGLQVFKFELTFFQ